MHVLILLLLWKWWVSCWIALSPLIGYIIPCKNGWLGWYSDDIDCMDLLWEVFLVLVLWECYSGGGSGDTLKLHLDQTEATSYWETTDCQKIKLAVVKLKHARLDRGSLNWIEDPTEDTWQKMLLSILEPRKPRSHRGSNRRACKVDFRRGISLVFHFSYARHGGDAIALDWMFCGTL